MATVSSTAVAAVAAAGSPIALGVALLIAQRLISGRRDPLRDDVVNLSLTICGWTLVAAGFLGNLACLQGPLLVVWGVFIAGVLVQGFLAQRAAKRSGLLWLLCVAAERAMPLVPAIEAFARDEGGRLGRRARRLADLLRAGMSLPDALARTPGLLPRQSLTMIWIGAQSGDLGAALRQAVTAAEHRRSLWAGQRGKVGYLLIVPLFGLPIMWLIVSVIAPNLTKIAAEYSKPMPSPTREFLGIAKWLTDYWPALLVFVAVVLIGFWKLMGHLRRGVGSNRSRFDWLRHGLDSAQILECLALMARQQRPLLEGIAGLASVYPKSRIRRQLADAVEDAQAGMDWAESLCRRGLIRQADLAILQSAQRAGNLPWALQEMAASNRRRFSYRLQAITQAAFPMIVILLGAIVAFVAVSLFLPIVTAISQLANYR
ncbi:MAG: type II secretion system F family protein [Thermoguttaceae bacterium]